MFLNCLLNLKNSNNNYNTDQATVMQEIGCSGFVRHVICVVSTLVIG